MRRTEEHRPLAERLAEHADTRRASIGPNTASALLREASAALRDIEALCGDADNVGCVYVLALIQGRTHPSYVAARAAAALPAPAVIYVSKHGGVHFLPPGATRTLCGIFASRVRVGDERDLTCLRCIAMGDQS